ncbi:PilZ domain-containing protein [Sphingomonas jaspsi]|uniref:PilZ domain-containing protein n=1 Tax=Sphingomonas jaspsi TaxID=392409 RepID=UPI0004B54FDF|nr:PilZ domain-containing protein [Sphingomonas jaspsi]
MAGKFQLDGSMIPRTVRRMFDQRSEPRQPIEQGTAVLTARRADHVVPLVNLSPNGAMIRCTAPLNIGESISLQMLDRDVIQGQVRWIRDGRVGIGFARPLE